MDGINDGREREGFEDQFRRMIVHSDLTTLRPSPEAAGPNIRPVVRLPPPATSHYQGAVSSPELPLRYGDPRDTASPQGHDWLPRIQTRPGAPPQKQDQRQRRTESKAQCGPIFNSAARPPPGHFAPHQRAQYSQQLDPNAFHRNGTRQGYCPQPPVPRQLFNPNTSWGQPVHMQANQRQRQVQYLEHVAAMEVPKVEMSQAERDEKEAFRCALQNVIYEVCDSDPEHLPRVSLACFGSFQSGFASAGSDMDLVIVLQDNAQTLACFSLMEDDLPRCLEKRLLQLGYGARLLTRTRVPIIKICEKPDTCLLDKLREEREKWDDLPVEKKYPHLQQEDETVDGEGNDATEAVEGATEVQSPNDEAATNGMVKDESGDVAIGRAKPTANGHEHATKVNVEAHPAPYDPATRNCAQDRREQSKAWTRERKVGSLDFPKSGVGIQSDINFFNPLGLHNTQLLRCYSACDPRVRPMVLFVKAWAKRRKINSTYSGTLSSYGYVLMVLHYLVNVAQPPVLPNLQMPWRPNPQSTPHGANRVEIDGWTVDFWRNENEISQAVRVRQMSSNQEPLGSLLAGFFNYFSSQGGPPQFHWMMDVLSLRTLGGLLTKDEKGWVKAITEEGVGKKIQHRFLFCIEDPFELAHNVARTVTHMGIVAIRDEFRRARRILQDVSFGDLPRDGELLAQLVEAEELRKNIEALGTGGMSNTRDLTANAKDMAYMDQLKTRNMPHSKYRAQKQRALDQPKQLDVANDEAFPALPAATAKHTEARQHAASPSGDFEFGEISGYQAKAYLEDIKRKKAETHAELTATGAAEAVLDGDD